MTLLKYSAFLLVLPWLWACEPADSPMDTHRSTSGKTIGLSLAGSDVCYSAAADVFTHLAQAEGWQVLRSDAQYQKEIENLNIAEFMAKQVDAVVVITTDIETAGVNTQRLQQAGIPVFFMMTLPIFPEGVKANAIVTTDWYMTGYLNGEFIAKHQPQAQCVLIEGGYDQGMTELMREGFLAGVKSSPASKVAVLANVTGSWMKPNAKAALESLLASELDFNCIFTGNEEMMDGVVDVLEQRELLGKYSLYSENGRPDVAGKYLKNGVMSASVDAATTQEGEIAFQLMKAYFLGEKTPYHVYSPVKLLTSHNIDQAVPWELDAYLRARESGEIAIDYKELQVVSEPRSWSKDMNNYQNILFHK